MDQNSFFLGLHTALAAQAIVACILCLSQSEVRNKVLGVVILVLMHNAFRGSLMKPLQDSFPLVSDLLMITTSQFYLPLLFLYLFSHTQQINLKHALRLLWAPLSLLIFSAVAILFWSYLSVETERVLITFFDGILVLVLVYFYFKGLTLIRNEAHWSGFRRNYVQRLNWFFVTLGTYFTFVGIWNFLRVIGLMTLIPEIDQSIQWTQQILFYLILLAIPLYSYSSITKLKQLFPPVKINIQPNRSSELEYQIDNCFIEIKKHKNPEFSAESLYNHLNFERADVRLFIEEEYKLSVTDFINMHRIKSFKDALKEQEHKAYDIYSVAQTCGFKSRSNFYRIFKQFEGVTPSEFIRTMS